MRFFQSLVTTACMGWMLLGGVASPVAAEEKAAKRIFFMAGKASHGYGSHEHYAGSMLLARTLQTLVPGVEVVVHRNGWPQDPAALNDIDCLVMYCDGGGRHPVNQHLEQVDQLAARGVGIVCIHYGVEVPKGDPGNRFLDWIGGYFETHWSVNPHWTAKFQKLPKHPITRGVKPFEINDEWYYHMRFREGMEGVTPILTAVPPASTLNRPDGAHSGNPHVRKKAGQPQHVAWAAERPDGGRGFGFTGGHFHWNWGDDNFRRLVLNAILWCAKAEVPPNGVRDTRPTLEQLESNQDEKPRNYDREKIRRQFRLKSAAAPVRRGRAKPAFRSKLVNAQTPGHSTPIEVDIRGARQLFLVVEDGGNGYSCDWADWAEPRLLGPKGERKLTDLKWRSAQAAFGQVRVNQNCSGGPLRVAGKKVAYGIGTHAHSVIAFDLPTGFDKFVARGGLDNGGTDQSACGSQSSVQFLVYTEAPPRSPTGANAASREPADAVAGLDVADGLEAQLFASEPELLSVTNLDIDHRGRIWVCEVVNYRKHNGKRSEGDRILILEDTDGDGQADKRKVFYQGRDVDSAMGICVLGDRVIVSCSPNVLVFTDSDGDDRPDRKEVLFTKTGQPQHDHSAHSFVFGPDGKLYWNFGNTGKAVHDRHGNVVVDRMGNEVVDNGRPYFGGMPFRCDMDGGNFEVLAHNFRNNYEVAVDSFGSLWQSDNDDDGNRGVRINFVMEYGNYGYREQGSGRGWREPRTGMHEEIPLRHWHLNDPGVVPNLLQTGAGSPTGIAVYEGRLLPKVFWDQVIHCDAGPNVVRAYPARPHGAGYQAKMVNVLHGARDNWFRPADVCVAPDGSLFVTDWYDPGVGGHAMGDLDRGRIFRVAPPDSRYRVPDYDFQSAAGAVAALQNPALSVRHLAWSALHGMGREAEPELLKLLESSDNPRHRARALWALGKLPGRAGHYVDRALADKDFQLRIVGLRLARQTLPDIIPHVAALVRDKSPAVLRECAIALHGVKSAEAAELWARLAERYDGQDRWYLEALGIGADGNWQACLDVWLKSAGRGGDGALQDQAARRIVWRSRGPQTVGLLSKALRYADDPAEAASYMRAFDFQVESDQKRQTLLQLAFGSPPSGDLRALVSAEAIKRIGNVDLSANPQYVKALEAMVEQSRGKPAFVELVARFELEDRYDQLLEIAWKQPDHSVGVAAAVALLDKRQQPRLRSALSASPAEPRTLAQAAGLARAMGNAGDGRAVALLLPLVTQSDADLELRRQATQALARSRNGAERLLEMAQSGQLPESLKSAAAGPLSAMPIREIRQRAIKLFPPPPAKNNEIVPPITELVKRMGDSKRGAALFAKEAQCANCHLVDKKGKEVGPDLSGIGKKLSRHAMFESILFPSAGISHNYENYLVQLESGTVVSGVLVSRSDQELVIRTEKAITRTIPAGEIVRMKKLDISLMPQDLQKTMTVRDLVDVVEYLTTLKAGSESVAPGG